jgi:hypothetical protein
MIRTATLSPCGLYRYELGRRWADEGLRVLWVMLNPSTADANIDDPTIRRVIDFSQRLGFSALTVVNLYAFRATDPRELNRASDPLGPKNYDYLLANAYLADKIICAWGNPGGRGKPIALECLPLWCMGMTKMGAPKHPLYLPAETQPERYA